MKHVLHGEKPVGGKGGRHVFSKNTSEGWPIYSDNEMYNFLEE